MDKKTVLGLLADVGDACDAYMDRSVRGLQSAQLQLDGIWSFCHAKQRNLPRTLRVKSDVGDLWTWTAIDADTKLIVTWHLGKQILAIATPSSATSRAGSIPSGCKSRPMA